jgi:hypothetical protein
MASQHTPGPWFVEQVDYLSSSFYIRGTDCKGRRMSSAKGAVAHLPRSTVMPSEANARLIAAAPDLLDFALLVARGIEQGHIKAKQFLDLSNADAESLQPQTIGGLAQTVIAKATGAA